MPDIPSYRTGKTLGELMTKTENPIKGLIRSGVAIKLLVGDNNEVNKIIKEVEEANKEFMKPSSTSSMDTRKASDLENLQGMALKTTLLI